MWSSWKEAAKHYLVSDMKRDIPKFDTVLLHSHWSSLRRKYLSRIPIDINVLSCGSKILKISGISDAISPALHLQKSTQHVRACATSYGAICSKNGKFVSYHRDSPNTRNGAHLRSPSPIMAPVIIYNYFNYHHHHHYYYYYYYFMWILAVQSIVCLLLLAEYPSGKKRLTSMFGKTLEFLKIAVLLVKRGLMLLYSLFFWQCSKTCEGGIITRTLRCKKLDNNGQYSPVPKSFCQNAVKPPVSEQCNYDIPCSGL